MTIMVRRVHQRCKLLASLIQADLDSYRNAPARRFYHLFGFPVTFVLKSVGGFLATQVAVYGWNYLSTLSLARDGSGSAGLGENAKSSWSSTAADAARKVLKHIHFSFSIVPMLSHSIHITT